MCWDKFKSEVMEAFPCIWSEDPCSFSLLWDSCSLESNSLNWAVGIGLLHAAYLWLINLLWLDSWSCGHLHAATLRGPEPPSWEGEHPVPAFGKPSGNQTKRDLWAATLGLSENPSFSMLSLGFYCFSFPWVVRPGDLGQEDDFAQVFSKALDLLLAQANGILSAHTPCHPGRWVQGWRVNTQLGRKGQCASVIFIFIFCSSVLVSGDVGSPGIISLHPPTLFPSVPFSCSFLPLSALSPRNITDTVRLPSPPCSSYVGCHSEGSPSCWKQTPQAHLLFNSSLSILLSLPTLSQVRSSHSRSSF